MGECTLFKVFEMPDKKNLDTLREAMIRIGEIEKSHLPLTNHADSFADLITIIEGENSTIKQNVDIIHNST